ncbi:hypothetical protein [Levilactobacillus acidifarinae]|nr:hypothetical protein [Levilactobacillus acidifarinae]GEO70554.1 hypothetical protein LAC03_24640 [Levilactobacillus acidifarinae]
MDKKFKLSFNKRSTVDILSVVFFFAAIVVAVFNGLGFSISSDQIDSIAQIILLILSGLGFTRNTSAGSSESQKVNASSVDTSKGLELGHELADIAVPTMAVLSALSKTDRGKEAERYVNIELKKRGFDFDAQTITGLVEKAYQAYKVSGGDNHAPLVTPAPTEEVVSDEGNDQDD